MQSTPFSLILRRISLVSAFTIAVIAPTQLFAGTGDSIADAVLGQPNFTGVLLADTASGMRGPTSVVVDPRNGRLYVSIKDQHRILSWPSASSFTTGQAADKVIGQGNFTSAQANRGGSANAKTLNFPEGLAVDTLGNLYVADTFNSRVLEFDDPSIDSGDITADKVFGQPDFVSTSTSLTASGMNSPRAVAIDPRGRLAVGDSSFRRVLGFSVPHSSGQTASKVWGQPDFTTSAANPEPSLGITTPTGLAFDTQGNLYVSDSVKSRVTEFDLGFDGDATPDRVFGQSDLTASATGVSQSTFTNAQGICIDVNGNLYVTDQLSNRILIFNSPLLIKAPVITEPAGGLLGQLNYTSGTASTSSTTFSGPRGCAFDLNGDLLVSDYTNSRVLRFDGYAIDSATKTAFTNNHPIFIADPVSGTSQITVSNVDGTVSRVIVTLKHVSHTWPADMDVYLTGPLGQKVALMSDTGGSLDILHAHITLDDQAANFLPDAPTQIVTGAYKPTNLGGTSSDPAAFTSASTSLSDFNGLDPNGVWTLSSFDDSGGDIGSIGAWGLDIYSRPSILNFVAPSTLVVGTPGEFSTFALFSDGDSVSYAWNFGDGTPVDSNDSVSHSFANAGSYFVTLTVTAHFGGSVSQSKTVIVNAAPTSTPTNTPTITPTPSRTPTATPSPTPTVQITPLAVNTPTATPVPTITAASKIDLQPSFLTSRKSGTKRILSFVVQNGGKLPSTGSKAQLFLSLTKNAVGSIVKTFTIPAIAAGKASKTFSFKGTTGKAKYFRVVVDSQNQVRELSEGNNIATKKI